MFVVFNDLDCFTVHLPWCDTLVVVHVDLGPSDSYFGLVSAVLDPVPVAVVTGQEHQLLELVGLVREEIHIIGHGGDGDTYGTDPVAEARFVDRVETGRDIGFVVVGTPGDTLSYTEFFLKCPGDFTFSLDVTFGVGVVVVAVLPDVSFLAGKEEFSHHYLSVDNLKGRVTVKATAETCLLVVNSVFLTFVSLDGAEQVRDVLGEPVLVVVLVGTSDGVDGGSQVLVQETAN